MKAPKIKFSTISAETGQHFY